MSVEKKPRDKPEKIIHIPPAFPSNIFGIIIQTKKEPTNLFSLSKPCKTVSIILICIPYWCVFSKYFIKALHSYLHLFLSIPKIQSSHRESSSLLAGVGRPSPNCKEWNSDLGSWLSLLDTFRSSVTTFRKIWYLWSLSKMPFIWLDIRHSRHVCINDKFLWPINFQKGNKKMLDTDAKGLWLLRDTYKRLSSL